MENFFEIALDKLSSYVYNLILLSVSNDDSDENGILAQLGEHLPYKQRVTGSSPVGPIKKSFK